MSRKESLIEFQERKESLADAMERDAQKTDEDSSEEDEEENEEEEDALEEDAQEELEEPAHEEHAHEEHAHEADSADNVVNDSSRKTSERSMKPTESEAEANRTLADKPAEVAEETKAQKLLKEVQVHLFCLDMCLPPIPDLGVKVKRPSFALMDAVFIFFNVCIVGMGIGFLVISFMILGSRSLGSAIMFFDTTGRLSNLTFGTALDTAAGVMIPLGLILIFTGGTGCVGAALFRRRLLMVYRTMMVGLVVCQVIGVLYTIVAHGTIGGKLQASMLKHIRESYEGTVTSTLFVSQVMDVAQVYFGCCGVLGWKDFQDSPWYRRVNNNTEVKVRVNTSIGLNTAVNQTYSTTTTAPDILSFPLTCCKADVQLSELSSKENMRLLNPACQTDPPGPSNPYTGRSCSQALKDWLWTQVIVFSSIGITILSMEASLITNAHGMIKVIEKLVAKKKKADEEEAEEEEGVETASTTAGDKPKKKRRKRKKKTEETNVDTGKVTEEKVNMGTDTGKVTEEEVYKDTELAPSTSAVV